ncbi:ABC transporter permease [Limosilactobacillus sp. STM2_1]|uniref:ABC transporter permease n=1 Tax=Limosilactobacillus rudii TaxID=2759755 RepID=A0A7W3UJB2_9LACO|nr:ABC transporter permease [Limosilactobacillus rudii]MBB1078419.1 ABC transporter permease [Limosilactobacillus rudii]MBB1096549.1 ABC transporter permease [Limosilactobacillus rudii]MCD7134255.1 ABC transporter permease [Limosilactobacillus rudii]
MQLIELFKSAIQSLKANKKRSFLTIIGIMIGIAAVIAILGIGDGITKTMYDKFGNNAKQGQQTTEIAYDPDNINSAVYGFTQEQVDDINTQFGGEVKKVEIEQETDNLSTQADVGDTTTKVSLSLLKKPTHAIKLIAGKNFTKQDLATGQANALMSESMAKKQYGTAQNALGTTVTVNNVTYKVTGVYKTQAQFTADGDQNSYGVNLLLPKALYYQENSVKEGDTLKLTFSQGANASAISRKVAKYLKKNSPAATQGTYQYLDMEKALKQFSSQMSIITTFISFIAAISLFIAGIGVMNMMYISVSERTQEIGIRLAVGATPFNIMMQFLVEAVILTLTGGLLGFLGGAGLAHLLAPLLSNAIGGGSGIHIHAHVSLNAFLLAFGTSAAVGLIFGILPARQAANKNLIDILR